MTFHDTFIRFWNNAMSMQVRFYYHTNAMFRKCATRRLQDATTRRPHAYKARQRADNARTKCRQPIVTRLQGADNAPIMCLQCATTRRQRGDNAATTRRRRACRARQRGDNARITRRQRADKARITRRQGADNARITRRQCECKVFVVPTTRRRR